MLRQGKLHRRTELKARSPLKRYTPLRATGRLRPRARRRKRAKISAPGYLAWIRTLPCLVCGGRSEAHHEGHHGRARDNDYLALPLCWWDHRESPHSRHKISVREGEEITAYVYAKQRRAFEVYHGLNLDAAIAGLNAEWELRNYKEVMPSA